MGAAADAAETTRLPRTPRRQSRERIGCVRPPGLRADRSRCRAILNCFGTIDNERSTYVGGHLPRKAKLSLMSIRYWLHEIHGFANHFHSSVVQPLEGMRRAKRTHKRFFFTINTLTEGIPICAQRCLDGISESIWIVDEVAGLVFEGTKHFRIWCAKIRTEEIVVTAALELSPSSATRAFTNQCDSSLLMVSNLSVARGSEIVVGS